LPQGNRGWHLWAIGGSDCRTYHFLKTRLGTENDPVTDFVIFPHDGARGTLRQVQGDELVARILQNLWNDESGQDIAEYAVMLAVILVIVVGTIRLIGSNANNVFSQVGSAIQ
jgi:Flp pilus assembly pilin Flp